MIAFKKLKYNWDFFYPIEAFINKFILDDFSSWTGFFAYPNVNIKPTENCKIVIELRSGLFFHK